MQWLRNRGESDLPVAMVSKGGDLEADLGHEELPSPERLVRVVQWPEEYKRDL